MNPCEVPIDRVSFRYTVQPSAALAQAQADPYAVERPAEGCLVYGLWMQGARWDATAYVGDRANGEVHAVMPILCERFVRLSCDECVSQPLE